MRVRSESFLGTKKWVGRTQPWVVEAGVMKKSNFLLLFAS